jgi:predicted methyltransferase
MVLVRLLFPLLCLACASSPPVVPSPSPPSFPAAKATGDILAASDRSAEDRALDAGRHPIELFAFAGVKPGMRVAEIGAWQGYTAELLARAVGPDGIVYAQDPPDFDQYTHTAWEARSTRPTFARIVRWARPFETPIAPDTPPLDVVFCVLFYHDTVWLGVDAATMNRAIFKALKPGGSFVVADHSARAGDGITVVKTLHRIEESVVKKEIVRAGFVLAAESDLLRHPEDKRDWSASDEAPSEKRGTSDRFLLRFKKP